MDEAEARAEYGRLVRALGQTPLAWIIENVTEFVAEGETVIKMVGRADEGELLPVSEYEQLPKSGRRKGVPFLRAYSYRERLSIAIQGVATAISELPAIRDDIEATVQESASGQQPEGQPLLRFEPDVSLWEQEDLVDERLAAFSPPSAEEGAREAERVRAALASYRSKVQGV